VTVLAREPHSYVSTFPSEIVTCRFNDGSELRLFYKYGACHSHNDYGHRGGIAYEAEVHRHVLQPLQVSVPTFSGAYTDRTIGKALLILEYLHNSVRVNLTPEPAAAISLAARWIERFHAANEARLLSAPMPFLNTADWACLFGCGIGLWWELFREGWPSAGAHGQRGGPPSRVT
jgi:hypothetical protein